MRLIKAVKWFFQYCFCTEIKAAVAHMDFHYHIMFSLYCHCYVNPGEMLFTFYLELENSSLL